MQERICAANFFLGIKTRAPITCKYAAGLKSCNRQKKHFRLPLELDLLAEASVKLRGGMAPPRGCLGSRLPLPRLGSLCLSHPHSSAPSLTWKILFSSFHPQKVFRVLKGGGDFRAEECKGRAVDRALGSSGGWSKRVKMVTASWEQSGLWLSDLPKDACWGSSGTKLQRLVIKVPRVPWMPMSTSYLAH